MRNYLGCSGWYYESWSELFYEGRPKKEWFKYYSEIFNTVEINNSFYRFPTLKAVKIWYKRAPKNFIYTIKANRSITHTKKFKGTKVLVKKFYKTVEELKEKLGCILFQLPPNLHYNPKKLKEIVSQLDSDKKNVIEFRHESWWNKDVYDALKKENIIFCIVNAPKLPEDFVKTSKDIYVRFHGKREWYAYKYNLKELKEYADKIKKAKAKIVWAYFNNDFNAYAPQNCLQFKKLF